MSLANAFEPIGGYPKLTKRVNKVPESSLDGLKEIGNLASWTVSTAKPGNGVEQLRDEDTSLFWQ